MRISPSQLVFEKSIYVSNGLGMVRTEPRSKAFAGFIKTSGGDIAVSFDNVALNDVLRDGSEVSKEEYDNYVPVENDLPKIYGNRNL